MTAKKTGFQQMDDPLRWAERVVGTYRRFIFAMLVHVAIVALILISPRDFGAVGAGIVFASIGYLFVIRMLLLRLRQAERNGEGK